MTATISLGLDFGTTNSILAYVDGDEVRAFRSGGAGGQEYIPSVLSFELDSGEVAIGAAARQHLTEPDCYEAFEKFKLFLGEDDPRRLEEFGFSREPRQITRAYLGRLIRDFEQQMAGGRVGHLVVTVPEIWVQEHQHAARERLKEICQNLGVGAVSFLSEPVAASAYFCHAHRLRHGRPFEGHLLVCDFGGGTLDISLSRVDGGRLRVLETTGRGHDPDAPGSAGVAFDEAVIRLAHGSRIPRSDPLWYELMSDFEAKKIAQRERVARLLDAYLKDPASNREATLFSIGPARLPVRPAHLVEAFSEKIEPGLRQALEQMMARMRARGVDPASTSSFRVVSVGGFSAFSLVQRALRGALGAAAGDDPRFASGLSLEDSALAIAKGAALVAAGKIEVTAACPVRVGLRVWAFRWVDGRDELPVLERKDLWLLERGAPVAAHATPALHPARLRIYGEARQTLALLIDAGAGPVCFDIPRPLAQLLPGAEQEKNSWRVGLSVDENLLFRFHAVDAASREQVTPLGEILGRGFPEAP